MRLDELTSKYKNNYKLSNVDTEECIELITQSFLGNEEVTMNYVCALPEQIGMKAFTEAYKKSSNKEAIINNIINYKEYEGKSQAYIRVLVIIKKLITIKGEEVHIKKLLYKLSQLVYKKSIVSPKHSKRIYNELVRDCNKFLFSLSDTGLESKEIYDISKMITYIIFSNDAMDSLCNNIQANTLQWLLLFKKKVSFNEQENKLVTQAISSWNEEILTCISEDVRRAYEEYFIRAQKLKEKQEKRIRNQQQYIEEGMVKASIQDKVISIQSKSENKIELTKEVSVEKNILEESKKDELQNAENSNQIGNEGILREISVAMHTLKKSAITIQALKAENLSIKQAMSSLESDLKEKKRLVEELEKEKINFKEQLGIHKQKNELINAELLKKEEQCEELQEKVKTIMEIDSRSLNHEFESYKNRLASTLRMEYRDFKEIQDQDMSIDLGENLRDQLNEIFDKLIRNDIKL